MSLDVSSPPRPATLRPNSIGLAGVLFQSITTMAPASAVAFSLGAAIPFAGGALPLAVAVALFVCVLIATNIGALARHLPSAGGYYTYVSHAFGVRAGWMTGWLFGLTYVLVVPLQLLVLGPVLDALVRQQLHLSLGPDGWVVWAIVSAAAIFALTYFGIAVSADAGVILGTIEIVIFLALAIWLIAGAGGGHLIAAFDPRASLEPGLGGWQGTLHGMIFAFLAFSGFESCAPIAEEARDPRRTVPRAIVLAAVSIGIFYVVCSYAAVVGWGSSLATYANDPDPWATMAARVWGPFALLAVVAIANSAVANGNAGVNSATRVIYAMGRDGGLPALAARIHPRFRTPYVAIAVVMLAGVVLALVPGIAFGPATAFALLGTIITLLILVVYAATCAAVPFYYARERRSEFSIVRHVVVPVVPLVVLIFPILAQIVPAPPWPLDLAAPICAAWLLIGLAIVAFVRVRTPQPIA